MIEFLIFLGVASIAAAAGLGLINNRTMGMQKIFEYAGKTIGLGTNYEDVRFVYEQVVNDIEKLKKCEETIEAQKKAYVQLKSMHERERLEKEIGRSENIPENVILNAMRPIKRESDSKYGRNLAICKKNIIKLNEYKNILETMKEKHEQKQENPKNIPDLRKHVEPAHAPV